MAWCRRSHRGSGVSRIIAARRSGVRGRGKRFAGWRSGHPSPTRLLHTRSPPSCCDRADVDLDRHRPFPHCRSDAGTSGHASRDRCTCSGGASVSCRRLRPGWTRCSRVTCCRPRRAVGPRRRRSSSDRCRRSSNRARNPCSCRCGDRRHRLSPGPQKQMSRPRIAVLGWIGSSNLGDELIAEQVARMIDEAGGEPSLVTISEASRTDALHQIRHAGALDTFGLLRELRRHDGVLFGGGGLIQDETGPLNLPFHLTRLGVARLLRRPWAAIGLGVGDVRRRSGRLLVRTIARNPVAGSVRDEDSANRLLALTGTRPELGIDPVLAQPPRNVVATDHLVVSLRPMNSPSQRRLAGQPGPAPSQIQTWAKAIDDIASTAGLGVRFVTWDDEHDHAIHEAAAAQLRTPAEIVRPKAADVIDLMGSGQLVISMRYHGAVAAVLTRRPALLLDYSPKMAAIAVDVGNGVTCLHPTAPAEQLSAAARALLDGPPPSGVSNVEQRNEVNRRVIRKLVDAASGR